MSEEIRSKGFYWINRDVQGWEVAEWTDFPSRVLPVKSDGCYWRTIGASDEQWDGYVLEVGSKVPPPHICEILDKIAVFYADTRNK